jgi:hypothetical protein
LEILTKLDEPPGRVKFGKFPNITSTFNPQLYEQRRMITGLLLAYDKIEYFSVNIIFSRQSPVLPDIQPKIGTFVRIFV